MNDKNTNIKDLKDKVSQFCIDRNWKDAHSPKNLAMSIAIEAAEIMEIFQWMSTEDAWDIDKTDEFEHLKEEIADVLIYCISLSNVLGIDISCAIEDKIIKNAIKYPIEDKEDL